MDVSQQNLAPCFNGLLEMSVLLVLSDALGML